MNDSFSLGDWIKRRRKALDLTQEALALRAFCALDTVKKIESGRRRRSRQVTPFIGRARELDAGALGQARLLGGR